MLLNTEDFQTDREEQCLREWAKEIVSDLYSLAPSRSKELISSFLFEIASAAAEQRQKEERRKKQADGIAAAKAKGVHFGRQCLPLPDDFDEYCQAWQDGVLSLHEAAESCGMGKKRFQRAALRKKETAERAAP